MCPDIDLHEPKKNNSQNSLHPVNVGKLVMRGEAPLIQPCTPKGIMELIRSTGMTITDSFEIQNWVKTISGS